MSKHYLHSMQLTEHYCISCPYYCKNMKYPGFYSQQTRQRGCPFGNIASVSGREEKAQCLCVHYTLQTQNIYILQPNRTVFSVTFFFFFLFFFFRCVREHHYVYFQKLFLKEKVVFIQIQGDLHFVFPTEGLQNISLK